MFNLGFLWLALSIGSEITGTSMIKKTNGFSKLAPSVLETIEALEQLRVLWHGHAIAVGVVDQAPPGGVDTPEDLARVRALFHS